MLKDRNSTLLRPNEAATAGGAEEAGNGNPPTLRQPAANVTTAGLFEFQLYIPFILIKTEKSINYDLITKYIVLYITSEKDYFCINSWCRIIIDPNKEKFEILYVETEGR